MVMARMGLRIALLVRSQYRAVTMMVLLLAAAGCSTATAPQNTLKEIVWPPPPETARIKFIRVVSSKNDLGKGSAQLITEALVGKSEPESLTLPMAVAPTPDGKRLYVTDEAKPGVFLIDFEKRTMKPFGWGLGTPSGGHFKPADSASAESFNAPIGIALDAQGNVYVADSTSGRVNVFDRDGRFLRTITHESLVHPVGIAVDSVRRRLYVADSPSKESPNHGVRVFDLDGNFITSIGKTGSAQGEFGFPTYVAVDAAGNLYVSDTMNCRVQKFDPDGRYLQTFGERGDAYGQFVKPKGVAVDTFGNVYVVDTGWSNVQIFNQRGQMLLFFAGRSSFPGLLQNPAGIAIDGNNRIYVADAFNGRVSIYQLINTTAEDSAMISPP